MSLTAETLTPRQHEVLGLLAEGLTNREISGSLDISIHTTKTHVETVIGRLGVGNRTRAVAVARRAGLLR